MHQRVVYSKIVVTMKPVDKGNEIDDYAVKVLVVDDLERVRAALVKLLGLKMGIEVIGEAEDGIRAVEKADVLMPDVILMDWKMPNIDGLTAAKSIKDSHPEIGVILFTIHNIDELNLHAHRAYVDEFIAKGIDADSLIKTIRKVYTQTTLTNYTED